MNEIIKSKQSKKERFDKTRFLKKYIITETTRMLEINYANERKIIKQYETESRVEKIKKVETKNVR